MPAAADKAKLIPADPEHCQAEISSYHPFRIGGSVRETRLCGEKPSVIATETKPGPDGRAGSMSLCASCLTQFTKQMPPGFATFKPIAGRAQQPLDAAKNRRHTAAVQS